MSFKHKPLIGVGVLIVLVVTLWALSHVAFFSGTTVMSREMFAHMKELHPNESPEKLMQLAEDRVRMLRLANKENMYADIDVQYAIEELIILKLRQKYEKPDNEVAPPPAEEVLKAYFEANQEKYREPEQRRVAIIQHDKANGQDDGVEFFNELQQFKETVTAPDFNAGYGFGQLASRYSSHGRSRLRGGDMGWLLKGDERDFPVDVDNAVWGIAEKGQISEVVAGDSTWYVLLSDLRKAEIPAYPAVKERVLYDYFQAQQQDTDGEWKERWASYSAFHLLGVNGDK